MTCSMCIYFNWHLINWTWTWTWTLKIILILFFIPRETIMVNRGCVFPTKSASLWRISDTWEIHVRRVHLRNIQSLRQTSHKPIISRQNLEREWEGSFLQVDLIWCWFIPYTSTCLHLQSYNYRCLIMTWYIQNRIRFISLGWKWCPFENHNKSTYNLKRCIQIRIGRRKDIERA